MTPGGLAEFAEKHGCIIGACDATSLDTARYAGFTPFVSTDVKKRTDPSAILPGATGVIAVGVGQPNSVGANCVRPDACHSAQLSTLGTAPDYHPRVRAVLRNLVAALQQHHNFNHKILVDSPNLDERAFAVRTGLGFLGRNGLVISREFGSRFNIGLLVHDISPRADMESAPTWAFVGADSISAREFTSSPTPSCPPNCRLCIDACPAKTNFNRSDSVTDCISYLTQKKDLAPDEEALLARSGQLYGCDICQNICPYNAPRETNLIDPRIWLCMTDEKFSQKYGHTAMLWQGPAILRRNAHILLSHAHVQP